MRSERVLFDSTNESIWSLHLVYTFLKWSKVRHFLLLAFALGLIFLSPPEVEARPKSRDLYERLLQSLRQQKRSRWLSTRQGFGALALGSRAYHSKQHPLSEEGSLEFQELADQIISEMFTTRFGQQVCSKALLADVFILYKLTGLSTQQKAQEIVRGCEASPHAALIHPTSLMWIRGKREKAFGIFYLPKGVSENEGVLALSGYTFNTNYSLFILDEDFDLSYESFMATFVHELVISMDGKLHSSGMWSRLNNSFAQITQNLSSPFRYSHVEMPLGFSEVLMSPLVSYGMATLRAYEVEKLFNQEMGFWPNSPLYRSLPSSYRPDDKETICRRAVAGIIRDFKPAWRLMWEYLSFVAWMWTDVPDLERALQRAKKGDFGNPLVLPAQNADLHMQNVTDENLAILNQQQISVDGQLKSACSYFAEPVIGLLNASISAGPRPRGSSWGE